MSNNEYQAPHEPIIQDELHELLNDIHPRSSHDHDNRPLDEEGHSADARMDELNGHEDKFFKLLEDAEQELYPGSKFTKLSFVVRLFHIKCLNGWSNKSFTMLLELLKEVLPKGEALPKFFYETKKIIRDLGLHYDKIDACPNDCMLYWKEASNDSQCRICGASRWKTIEGNSDEQRTHSSTREQKVPAKILRHFPLKPTLQRLYMSTKTASFMTWHYENRTKDDILRHLAGSTAWQTFDYIYPWFSSEPRNVRLGLASDGFNPFRTMSIAHSTWPAVVIPYNLPPWMCMKQPYIMLSLLIPGPSSPGNDIDVYLEPLIEELKELWVSGLQTYDASRQETFQMHASLLWTISDFPAYANLSGWSTKGKLSCPSCNKDTCSLRLKHGRKFCYMGHRRFLEANHRFRSDKSSFNGTKEKRLAPIPLSGTQVLDQLQSINITFGKKQDTGAKKHGKRGKKRVQGESPLEENSSTSAAKKKEKPPKEHNWKKKSIFFSLPYWESLLLRHNLDVMHIEKNVCDSVIGTLLNIEGKTKDIVKARLDLQEMGLRRTLHTVTTIRNKTYLPSTCFTMSPKEKEVLCNILKDVKLPDGYSSNISRRVNVRERKISGLKSHDCHVLMQQLLPLAIHSSLPKNISSILIEICNFFKELCPKVLNVGALLKLQDALTLCHMEKIFPPASFDIMVHLPIHLADEAMSAGPVQYRWMYPIERYLLTLKSYVRNRSRPEGSIAEGYLAEECLTFCSRYLEGVESKLNRPVRNDEDGHVEMEEGFSIFSLAGRPLGEVKSCPLDQTTIEQAHRYVLFNCPAVSPFIAEHVNHIQRLHPRARARDIEQIHNKKFPTWFGTHVQNFQQTRSEHISEKLRWLAGGPAPVARKYKGFISKGFRFHTKAREQKRKTQNCGVVVTANTRSFSSARDQNPIAGDISYYGVLTDIIELNYFGRLKALLFKCDWFDVVTPNRGIKIDAFGYTVVNMTPEQVFYVQDHSGNKDWHVVVKTKPRDLYEVHGNNDERDVQTEAAEIQNLEDVNSWERIDIVGTKIDEPLEQLTQAIPNDEECDTDSDDSDGDESPFANDK
ncbi:uncharacterized protein LOC143888370 [Tasmannia lanceolata]|uniref:uncharacterized protein LOC143888370 n=1 Tax=Tasmannia lanceolata TaxID=3420 RepID=UPI0040638FF4